MPPDAELTALSETQREQALRRFQLLQPFLENNVPLSAIARQHGIPLRTMRRWVARYRQVGLVGLARQSRADRGQHRLAPELQRLIEGLALQKPQLSIAAIHRQVIDLAAQQDWAAPSYSCVYDVVCRLDPALVTLAHEGSKVYHQTYDLLFRREASRPNEIWQADHTLLDIWLLDDQEQLAQPWLTVIEDDYSRCIAGYYLSFQHPNTLNTALTLHQAIWRKAEPRWSICGIPDIFYTDHGSDFTSTHMEQVSADLKMRLVFSTPGMPRGRGRVERFFRTLNQLLLHKLPGYAPAGQPATPPSLTLTTFEEYFKTFLLNEYHLRPQQALATTPQVRWEVDGFLPRMPESLAQLDLLLLTVARTRRIRRDGIHFQGLRYIDLTLSAYVGEDVTIRYDPRDMAEIRVYYRSVFLCRALCQELAGQTISLKDIIRARNRRRRQLRGTLNNRAEAVQLLLAAHQPDPPILPPQSTADPPPTKQLRYYENE
jgi:putative transposase